MAKASPGPFAAIWCKMMHRSPMWPVHGYYRCRTCLLEYPVPWELGVNSTPSQHRTPAFPAGAPRLGGKAISRAA